jgi:hypothetical protein
MMLRKVEITLSSEELLRQVSSCQLSQVGLKNSSQRSLTITEMTEPQQQWVKLFHCEKMIKPKVIDQFNKFLH